MCENDVINCHKCENLLKLPRIKKYPHYICNETGMVLDDEYLPHPFWCPRWQQHVENYAEQAINMMVKQR